MNKTIKYIIGIITSIIILFVLNIFEIDFGRCLNNTGDGKLYNDETFYNYISYNGIAKENDIVMTFSINDIYGDCAWRGDIVIFKNT